MTTKVKPTVEKWEKKIKEPLDYINKWVVTLTREAINAKGYTPGEKQVVLMNLNKIRTELKVARLILKEDVLPIIASSVQEAKVEEREKQFTQDELNIMWIDYKSLVATTNMMNRTVVGDKKLGFILDSNDQIREEILEKLNSLSTLNTKASLKQEEEGVK